VAHLYVVQVDANERESLRRRIGVRGIATDVHYPVPDHKQKAVGERFAHVRLPVTEAACERVLTLPCFPEMTDAEVAQVIQAVNGR
jgi:dTDP-4-amino-4,6-dideoxygalactose transaminase